MFYKLMRVTSTGSKDKEPTFGTLVTKVSPKRDRCNDRETKRT